MRDACLGDCSTGRDCTDFHSAPVHLATSGTRQQVHTLRNAAVAANTAMTMLVCCCVDIDYRRIRTATYDADEDDRFKNALALGLAVCCAGL